MHSYPRAAVERMMKVQEVILRAMAKKISWWQAAEIIGMSDRQMRRLHWRYREHGYDGLFDRRVGKPSPKRVPLALVEQVLALYQEKYFDLNVQHFHEKLKQEHQIRLSYTWRSKEHTSELQSPCNLVCRLLLEKNKTTHTHTISTYSEPYAQRVDTTSLSL